MEKIAKIEGFEIYLVQLPLVTPFQTSFSTQTYREALLVKLSASGEEGWGECVASPEPFYSYETNKTCMHIIKDFLFP